MAVLALHGAAGVGYGFGAGVAVGLGVAVGVDGFGSPTAMDAVGLGTGLATGLGVGAAEALTPSAIVRDAETPATSRLRKRGFDMVSSLKLD